MNEILDIQPYSNRTVRLRINNPEVAERALPGNFIIVRFSEDGVRIPFSIVDTNPGEGTIDFIIHRAEGLDEILGKLTVGEALTDLLGPLGKPAVIDSDKKILCCGDGGGLVPLLPLAKALSEKGCSVSTIISESSDKASCLSDDIMRFSKKVELVPQEQLLEIVKKTLGDQKIEKVIVSGPTKMMKSIAAITEKLKIPTDCILNMIMIDGIGLCGTCRVIVGGERKQTCIDGPIFNAHLVDFDQLLNRQRLFS